MPKIIKPIINKVTDIFSRFSGSKPKPPKMTQQKRAIYGGERGRALRDLSDAYVGPDGEMVYPNADESTENIEKWARLTIGDIEGFVYDQEPLFVHSSNVAVMQYFIHDRKMMVEFLNGSAYIYENVSEQEAIKAAEMASKGDFIWSYFRVRGSKTAHQKPYSRIK